MAGGVPPRGPPKVNSVRRSVQGAADKNSVGGESIYNYKEPQPNVVVYSAE